MVERLLNMREVRITCKAKTFVQLSATTTLVSLAPEGDGPSERG